VIPLAAEYTLMAFVASLGVLQAGAARAKLWGLLFFRREASAYIFAALSIVGAFSWFFRVNRNIPDFEGGLAGGQQFLCFSAAVLLAIIFTILLSSLIKGGKGQSSSQVEGGQGLDVLREMTYFEAIRRGKGRKGG